MRLTALLLVSMMLLSGCVQQKDTIVEEPVDEVPIEVSCDGPEKPEWLVTCEFPEFNLTDDSGNSHNLTSTNGSGRWIAYFSAYWCTHCKPTMTALDNATIPGHLLVFNIDEGDDNMSAWKQNQEEELNRTLNHPFIHAPDIADFVEVGGIPHILLIENSTIIAARIGLWQDDMAISMWFNATNPESGHSQGMMEM